ncbi:hypothetical protein EAE96_002598 [Botrytis aclada]|nr:hypothetical protein EAE96_002598 [Botrytis aclada]
MNTAKKPKGPPLIKKKKILLWSRRRESHAADQITVKFSLPANRGTFELPKENISVQPSLPSSSLGNRSNSITGDIKDLTKTCNEVLERTKDEINIPLDTLLSAIAEGEKFLASVKTKATAHQHMTAELRAKLRAAETELKESTAALNEEITHFKEVVAARDNEIARLRREADRLSGEKDKMENLVQRNLELESTMEKQSAKLKESEDWRMQMRRMLSEGDVEA